MPFHKFTRLWKACYAILLKLRTERGFPVFKATRLDRSHLERFYPSLSSSWSSSISRSKIMKFWALCSSFGPMLQSASLLALFFLLITRRLDKTQIPGCRHDFASHQLKEKKTLQSSHSLTNSFVFFSRFTDTLRTWRSKPVVIETTTRRYSYSFPSCKRTPRIWPCYRLQIKN